MALQSAPLRHLLLDKHRRITAVLLLHAALACTLATFAPSALLVLGPLLVGIPHVVADIRYLVIRPDHHRGVKAWLALGATTLFGVGLAQELGLRFEIRAELLIVTLFMVGAALLSAGSERKPQAALAWGLIAAFGAFGWGFPSQTKLLLAHLHNVVALGLWVLVFAAKPRFAFGLALLLLTPALVFLASPLAYFGFQNGFPSAFGLHALSAADQLAPFASDTVFALGVVAAFAYLQSVHYGMWLIAIPEETVATRAPLTARATVRRLLTDLGPLGLALAAVCTLALGTSALFEPLAAKRLYLTLSAFHGYLELAVLIVFLRCGRSVFR